MPMEVVNPATGELVRSYAEATPELVDERLTTAQECWQSWRRTSFEHRAALMRRAAVLLRERAEQYGQLMTLEMGKPISGGIAEAQKCAWVCDYYADNAEQHLADVPIETDATRSYVSHQPLGAVLAVMPWNFPFWQVLRFAAPALMAGNVGVLKHASNVPGCALAIEAIFRDAGFPEGAFTTLLVPGSGVGAIIDDPRIVAVTLTGSTPAGRAVAARAGQALKKCVLELGGSDPYVILEDADLEQAAALCAFSRLLNSGQSCIAAKRFIVVESVREEFERLFVEQMAQTAFGDPLDPATVIGPQARVDLRDELHGQVQATLDEGARLLLGGIVPDQPGAWYPATALTDVRPGMTAYRDELFGPVAAIIGVSDEAEAIEVANDTVFGLGAAVFTRDTARGDRIAREELQAGACFVNGFVKSDPRLPFGGIKESGFGRELAGLGIREFVNAKTVWIR